VSDLFGGHTGFPLLVLAPRKIGAPGYPLQSLPLTAKKINNHVPIGAANRLQNSLNNWIDTNKSAYLDFHYFCNPIPPKQ
jgi:hypothetical protein